MFPLNKFVSKCGVPISRSIVLTVSLFALSAVAHAAEKTEVGELNGAAFRIDVPEPWNGSLVIYCHGYSPFPGRFQAEKPDPLERVFLDAGFAVAQSGYSAGGWAVEQGEVDTLSLQRYFTTKYAAPKQTFLTGHSMGGFLTMMLMERYPANFTAGMPMCGPLEPALHLLRRAFDDQIVFNYFLPGVLPPARDIPADYIPSPELTAAVNRKLEANPRALAALEKHSGLKSAEAIAGQATFWTLILKQIYRRAGGNSFDNRSTIYWDTGDDNALNTAVPRAAADPQAVDYLRAFYTPTGRIEHPMLAIHTTYDQLVNPTIPNGYFDLALEAGRGDLFVQQFVEHDGHCAIRPAEVASGFAELRAWVDSGKKPVGGAVPVP